MTDRPRWGATHASPAAVRAEDDSEDLAALIAGCDETTAALEAVTSDVENLLDGRPGTEKTLRRLALVIEALGRVRARARRELEKRAPNGA